MTQSSTLYVHSMECTSYLRQSASASSRVLEGVANAVPVPVAALPGTDVTALERICGWLIMVITLDMSGPTDLIKVFTI